MSTQRIQAPTGGVSIVWRQAGASDGVSTLLPKRGHKLAVGTGGYGKETWAYASSSGITGTLATTNANDTLSASGSPIASGTLARTNANDTLSASGSIGNDVSGTVVYTNANDTLDASGTTAIVGTVARSNANDTSAASGTPVLVGTLATTNANDTLAGSGVAGSISGSVSVTNNNDTSSASGPGGPFRGGGGFAKRRAYLINGRKRWLTDAELAVVVANELLPKSEVKTVKNGKIKPVPQEVWKEVTSMVESIQRLDPPDDEDEDEEMMLLYA